VAGVAATGPYATGWTLAVGALAVGYAVAAPTAPLVVGVAVAFLARVVAHDLYGRGAAGGLTERTGADSGTRRADGTVRGAARPEGRPGTDPGASRDGAAGRDLGRTGNDPPTHVVSGDGGQPMRGEPPAPVQVGRDVSVNDRGDAVGGGATGESGEDATAPADGGADSAGGFEWGPALADAEDKS
jgi:hypothetical protein